MLECAGKGYDQDAAFLVPCVSAVTSLGQQDSAFQEIADEGVCVNWRLGGSDHNRGDRNIWQEVPLV